VGVHPQLRAIGGPCCAERPLPFSPMNSLDRPDPHHLRFAQGRALGRKVSDEFTVPLCRTYHREIALDRRHPGRIPEHTRVYFCKVLNNLE
jgi:hypothetical protein